MNQGQNSPQIVLQQGLQQATQLAQSGQFDQSISLLKKLRADFPGVFQIAHHIGFVYEQGKNDSASALPYFLNAYSQIVKHPNRSALKQEELTYLNSLGNAYKNIYEYAEARKCLEKSLTMNPSQQNIEESLAICIFHLEEPDKVIPHLKKAVKKYANSAQIKSLLSSSLLKVGCMEEGLRYQQESTGILEFSQGEVKLLS